MILNSEPDFTLKILETLVSFSDIMDLKIIMLFHFKAIKSLSLKWCMVLLKLNTMILRILKILKNIRINGCRLWLWEEKRKWKFILPGMMTTTMIKKNSKIWNLILYWKTKPSPKDFLAFSQIIKQELFLTPLN